MNHWRLRELRRIAEISIDRQGLLDHSQRYAVPTEINSELSIIPEHEIFAERILSRVSRPEHYGARVHPLLVQ